jgi:hypothetical protein
MQTPSMVPVAFMCATGDILVEVQDNEAYETGQEPAQLARVDDSKQ